MVISFFSSFFFLTGGFLLTIFFLIIGLFLDFLNVVLVIKFKILLIFII